MSNPTAVKAFVGERLRERRKELGLIMQDVAQASGLSIGFISQVERDLAVPSLGSLAAIARVLQVSPASLLPPTGSEGAVSAKAPEGPITRPFPGSRLLAEMRVDAPGGPRRSQRTECELLIMVMGGGLTVEIDGNTRVLNPGQSVHLPAGCHLVDWNHTGGPTTVLQCAVAQEPAPLAI